MKDYTYMLKKVADHYDAPSVVMSVHANGETKYFCYGEANREAGVKADENTIFYIGSCSKAFIATAIGMLVDDGLVTFNTPVRDIIPGFRLANDELTNGLLVRDVISHSAGLETCDMMWQTNWERPIPELVEKVIPLMKPLYPFRTNMNYQNHMFGVASYIVELLTGKPWDEYVKTRIWEPLGMTRTYARASYVPADEQNRTVGYQIMHGKVEPVNVVDPYTCCGAAGSILSTITDMNKWLCFNEQDCVWNGERLISENVACELHAPQTIIHPSDFMPIVLPGVSFENYAFGWFVESLFGNKLIQHGGSIEGHNAKVGVLPEKGISVCVLTNLSRRYIPDGIMYDVASDLMGIENDMCGFCMQLIGGMIAQITAAMPQLPETPVSPAHELCDYTGSFCHDIFGTIVTSVRDGSLYIKAGNIEGELVAVGGDDFLLDVPLFDMIAPVHFELDAGAKAAAVVIPLEETQGMSEFKRIA